MIATKQTTPENHHSSHGTGDKALHEFKNISPVNNIPQTTSQLFFPNRTLMHDPQAGLNPLVDAAGYLFSVLGKLKNIQSYRQLHKLQKELIQEINVFQETIKSQGYNAEYVLVCRYVICATFDDVIVNTSWGNQGQWENYSLLANFNQDVQHEEKFFTIIERALKEPTLYIDLMELMYICLSMGYKGQYGTTLYNQFQLDQITHNLYKHIRAYRGSFSKALSPLPLKITKAPAKEPRKKNHSSIFIFCVTASIIMTIFISLSILMDLISNEAYKSITQIEKPVYQTF